MNKFTKLLSLTVLLILVNMKAAPPPTGSQLQQKVGPKIPPSESSLHANALMELRRFASSSHLYNRVAVFVVWGLTVLGAIAIYTLRPDKGSSGVNPIIITAFGVLVALFAVSILPSAQIRRDDDSEKYQMKQEYYSPLEELRGASVEYCLRGDLVSSRRCNTIYEDLLQARYKYFWYKKVLEARTRLQHVKDAAWRAQQSV